MNDFASSLPHSINEEASASSAQEGSGASAPKCILILPVAKGTHAEKVTLNIAAHFQHEVGFRVLIIDGRLSRDSTLVVDEEDSVAQGFVEVAEGVCEDVSKVLVQDDINDWCTIGLGNSTRRLTQRMVQQGFSKIVDQVGDRFDYIIVHTLEPVDCPVAKALAGSVDIACICVQDRKTNASTMKNAWELLKNHDAAHLSVIIEKRAPKWLVSLHQKIQAKLPFKLPFEL